LPHHCSCSTSHAVSTAGARVKDIVDYRALNQLVGYGLVVGLAGKRP
jgi:flagellar basal body P-ring protein FlgI